MSSPIDFGSLLSDYFLGDLSEPENSIWLVYTAVIIESISTASHISELWKYIASTVKQEEKQILIARRLREGLLKASPLAGFPRGINCLSALLKALNETSPSIAKIYVADHSLRASLSSSELSERGEKFFNRVYGKVALRVKANMALSSGADLDLFALRCIYGELMAEERILNAKETGLLEFVVCLVSGAAPQAKGHLYGCRNLGCGREEVEKAVGLVRKLAERLEVRMDWEGMWFVEDGWKVVGDEIAG